MWRIPTHNNNVNMPRNSRIPISQIRICVIIWASVLGYYNLYCILRDTSPHTCVVCCMYKWNLFYPQYHHPFPFSYLCRHFSRNLLPEQTYRHIVTDDLSACVHILLLPLLLLLCCIQYTYPESIGTFFKILWWDQRRSLYSTL